MRRVCFCGFLETREHSFICNCHLQLIIAWYILYINNVTYYTQSSELSWGKHHNRQQQPGNSGLSVQAQNCKGDVDKHKEPACVCMHPSLQCTPSGMPNTNIHSSSQELPHCSQTLRDVLCGRGGGGHTSRYLDMCAQARTDFWVLAVAGTAV